MSKPEQRILLVLGAVVLAVFAAVLILRGGGRETVVTDFTPPPFDPTARSGQPEGVDETIYGTLNLADGIAVSLYSAPAVTDGAARVYFASDADNTAWVRLRVLDTKGGTLGETGLLRPGEYVSHVTLDRVPRKSGPAVIKILTYEPDTYYSMGSASAQIILNLDKK